MLVAFPIGLWVFSLVSDIIYFAGLGRPIWSEVALYTMGGGIVGALLAAIPGFVDLFSMQDPRPKRVGLIHMTINLCLVVAFAVNWWLRYTGPRETTPLFVLSIVSVIVLAISGWLGGEMIYKYGVSVDVQHDLSEQERAKIRSAA
jgi:uncharacterized membrane protein